MSNTLTHNIGDDLERADNTHEQEMFQYFDDGEYEQDVDDLDQNIVLLREIVAPVIIEGKKFLTDGQLDLINAVLPHIRSGEVSKAVKFLFKKFKEVNLSYEERYQLFHLLGVTYSQAGKTNLAIDSYQSAIDIVKGKQNQLYVYQTYACIGVILFRNFGDLTQALEYAEKALTCNRTVASPYVLKMNVLLMQGNAFEFEATLKSCRDLIVRSLASDVVEFLGILLERFESDPFLEDWTKLSNYQECNEILSELRQWSVSGKSEFA